MEVLKTVKEVQDKVTSLRSQGKTIGFVPTMGALHEGHLSLVKQCIADNDICIVSIFVNPTQFNNKEDLVKYPRNLEKDSQYLAEAGVNFIFAPLEKEIYPEPDTRQFDFGQIDKVMEGVHRPGHFNGVAQVVSRLFDIVKPDKAYFGEKDFQQLAIIREMVKQLNLPVQIVAMPIVREASGLALSSRNERLTSKQKEVAVNISKTLSESKKWMDNLSVKQVINKVTDTLNSFDELNVEYYEIADGYTLQSVKDWKGANYIVGCIAVFCGDVRLIDNIIYKA
ncbi:MAG: pantoate--beta-alanine ligase [Prevotella sp.]|jgi:pantoate--beta-alanine ligase|nr:pantoate--beta-alanine ligase [Prevotella sp.]